MVAHLHAVQHDPVNEKKKKVIASWKLSGGGSCPLQQMISITLAHSIFDGFH